MYNCVHISSNKAFFKILKKPSIVQRTLPHMKANNLNKLMADLGFLFL